MDEFDAYEHKQIHKSADFLALNPATQGPGGYSLLGIRGNKTVFFGDSTTYGGSDMPNGVQGDCYATYAGILSNQRIQFLYNAGVAGNKTADMVARIQADVINRAPARCIVLGGTNDVGNSVPFANTVANLKSIVASLLGAGIEPILGTITPRSDNPAFHAGIVKLNAWIKGYCTANGLQCIDFYNVLVDPANGNYLAGQGNVDGIHPSTTAGMITMATEAARLLPLSLPAYQPYLTGANDATDNINMIVNGTMQSGGTRATSWTLNSGLVNITESIAAAPSGVVGNWQVITCSGAASYDLIQTINAGSAFAVGDKVALSGVISITAPAGTVATIRAAATGGTNEFLKPVGGLTGAITQGTFYMEGVVPSGTTALVVHITLTGVNGTILKVAQATLINLTQLGL